MDIGAINQSAQPLALHGSKAGIAQTVNKKSDVEQAPVKIPAVDKVDIRAQERGSDDMKQAIRKALATTYAVSDTSFTIFKDAKGEYVTRVTSLRDGSVTYLPEPDLKRQMELTGVDTSLLKLNV